MRATMAREMLGALFKNKDKRQDNHPDYRGDVMIEGQTYEVAGWIKTSEKAGTYMSLSLKPAQNRTQRAMDRRPAAEPDIPF
jgi:uncharacterized protein (DUF736 family)